MTYRVTAKPRYH